MGAIGNLIPALVEFPFHTDSGRVNRGSPKINTSSSPEPGNVTLNSSEDFAYVIKLSISKLRDYHGLSGWVRCHHKDT